MWPRLCPPYNSTNSTAAHLVDDRCGIHRRFVGPPCHVAVGPHQDQPALVIRRQRPRSPRRPRAARGTPPPPLLVRRPQAHRRRGAAARIRAQSGRVSSGRRRAIHGVRAILDGSTATVLPDDRDPAGCRPRCRLENARSGNRSGARWCGTCGPRLAPGPRRPAGAVARRRGCRPRLPRVHRQIVLLEIEVGGHADVSVSDRPPFRVIGRQQILAAPSVQHCRELPAKVNRVADSGVHPERAGRRQLMNGVAGEKNAGLRVALGDHTAAGPYAGAEPFHLERPAECAAQIAFAVDGLRRKSGTGIEHHQPPHGARRIDDADVRPHAAAIDREDESGGHAAAGCSRSGARK